MAQAARLNLRMQKELKLLLTDPPPFASFPLLSPNSDLSTVSLSSLLAHIEGPEDTVYAKGVFKINIQIPERYPFQPPIVTFATPIYHPNIDTGGRICLDILNLPPKGAWQPSLNISTVLTSILLLLSEPNPDDGLMCEASKEYKYNRQAFDQKARYMTEKYARSGTTEKESGIQNTESHLNPSKLRMETEGSELSKFLVNELLGTHKTVSPRKKKLALESSVTNNKKDNDNKANEASLDKLSRNQMEVKAPKRQPTEMLDDHQKHEKFHSTRRKLSLDSLGLNRKRSIESNKKSILKPQNVPVVSSESLLVQQDINRYEHHSHQKVHKTDNVKSVCDAASSKPKEKYIEQCSVSLHDNSRIVSQPSPANSNKKLSLSSLRAPMNTSPCDKQPQKNSVDRSTSGFIGIKHKRLGLAGRKQSLGLSTSLQSQDKDGKENMVPVSSVLLSNPESGESFPGKVGNSNLNVSSKKVLGIRRRLPLEPLGRSNGSDDSNIQLNLRADNPNGTPSKSLSVSEENIHSQKQQLQQNNITTFAGQMKDEADVSPMLDSVIVLDSEDSDEEKERSRWPKLSLVHKRVIGKRYVKA